MSDLLKIIGRHKGKGSVLLIGLVALLCTRGCRVSFDLDPVNARTNVSPNELITTP